MSRRILFGFPALVLVLFALLGAAVVDAAPPAAPLAGITVTPTMPALTPTPTPDHLTPCDPIIDKQVSPGVASPGDEVVFAITVVNEGQEAAVEARVIDRVPEYLEILEVRVIPEEQGQEILPRSGQTVLVDLGTLGQDFLSEVVIRARVRENVPAPVCIENVAEFRAPNCPDRSAEVACWQLPKAGGPRVPWTLITGSATSVLVLGLALARKPWRARR